jgi:hypothetical protein
MQRCFWLAVSAICLLLLGGCATNPAVDRSVTVSAETRAEVKRLLDHELATNQLVYQLSRVGVEDCKDAGLDFRAPFSLLYNNTGLSSKEMRTAIFNAYGLEGQAMFQSHTPELAAYDGARVVEVNGESTHNPNKVLGSTLQAMQKQRKLSLKFEDGRSVEALGQRACPSLVNGDFTGIAKHAVNYGGFIEMLPTAWAKLIRTPDELAFVLARSIYFTGAEGQAKLRHALYAGAAVSGVLRAVTFGVSALVTDPKTLAVQARRRANRLDADAFALRLMRRAGFDVNAALAFAQRSLDEGAIWPGECDELRFDQERFDALKAALAV